MDGGRGLEFGHSSHEVLSVKSRKCPNVQRVGGRRVSKNLKNPTVLILRDPEV